jgi:hypothetical protein
MSWVARIAAIAMLAVSACARQPAETRSFPTECPAGWSFLFIDYGAGASRSSPPVVCRRVRADSAAMKN